jgi:two-component system sensor histidine kinase DesK
MALSRYLNQRDDLAEANTLPGSGVVRPIHDLRRSERRRQVDDGRARPHIVWGEPRNVTRLRADILEEPIDIVEIARRAAADERLRIARDLHDLLGNGLSLIALKAQLAGRLLPTDAALAAVEVADIEAVSRRALEDVRAAVGGYRRLTLDSELVGARAALLTAGVTTEVDHRVGSLPDDCEEAFAWSIREGATNVVRHGQARRAVIRTRRAYGAALLEIVNDRVRSTSAEDLWPAPGYRTGSGLAGLAERAGAIGGRVEAAPLPDGGYRLAVVVPLQADAA